MPKVMLCVEREEDADEGADVPSFIMKVEEFEFLPSVGGEIESNFGPNPKVVRVVHPPLSGKRRGKKPLTDVWCQTNDVHILRLLKDDKGWDPSD